MVIWSVLKFSSIMQSKSSIPCNDFMIIWPLMVLAHSCWHFLYSLQTVQYIYEIPLLAFWCHWVLERSLFSLSWAVFSFLVTLNIEWQTHFQGHYQTQQPAANFGQRRPLLDEKFLLGMLKPGLRSWMTTQPPVSSFREWICGQWG